MWNRLAFDQTENSTNFQMILNWNKNWNFSSMHEWEKKTKQQQKNLNNNNDRNFHGL